MDEDWRNIFGILMCMEVCDGTGMGICNGMPSTCSNFDWAVKLQTNHLLLTVYKPRGSIS